MQGHGILFESFVYLLAALVSVPLAKRLGLGSVLGYLAAGVLIGPAVLGLVGRERGMIWYIPRHSRSHRLMISTVWRIFPP